MDNIDRHLQICREQGLSVHNSDEIYNSNTYGTPFKRKVQTRVLPRFKELISTIVNNTKITIRGFYYHLAQSPNPDVRIDISTGEKSTRAYANVMRIVNRARLGGLIPFKSIVDDTDLEGTWQYKIPINQYLTYMTLNYRSNWFEKQDCYVEVWLEKRALKRTVKSTADTLGVLTSCSGKAPTWSQVHSAIQRFKYFGKNENYILYFGDLDPSGKDMYRWLDEEAFNVLRFNKVELIEVALNPSDVKTYNLVTLPLKTGSRKQQKLVEWYKDNYYADYGVELDALEPHILKQKVEDAILDKLDIRVIDKKKHDDKQAIDEMNDMLSSLDLDTA